MDMHLHKRERKRKEGEEGAGDRRGLSPFLHPTLRAPLRDRATSDQPRRRASAPMTEPLRLAVPATGWIPTEYTDERHSRCDFSSSSLVCRVPEKQTESQINPLQFLSSAAIHILDCARLGKLLELFTPTLPNTQPPTTTFTPPSKPPPIIHTHTHTFHLQLPLLLLLPTPPSSSPLQNEMPVSDRLSQFADPCGTLPFRPGHCASRSLAKRRGIIFIPQTRGYTPMISNACLAHCRG
ncbi:hypothetical protein Q8A73_018674 [Channa argus]|nr:hypothetical protein Q8A73_018674 [Channa argus]